jgi:hypothetical protein
MSEPMVVSFLNAAVAVAGSPSQLVGYFGSGCPHGPDTHLHPVWFAWSGGRGSSVRVRLPYGPETRVRAHCCGPRTEIDLWESEGGAIR